MKKLVLSTLLASLLAACASQPPAATDSAAAAGTSTSATPAATAAGSTDATATAAGTKPALTEQQQAEQARAAEEAARAESERRQQENLLKANSVYFGFNEFGIAPEYEPVIKTQAAHAKTTGAKVRVEGNTDERGSREYNLALGSKRARAVAAALVTNGVEAGKVEAVSFGEEKPRAEGSDEEAWSVNRRADIVFPQ